jgi:hypothetical protein
MMSEMICLLLVVKESIFIFIEKVKHMVALQLA